MQSFFKMSQDPRDFESSFFVHKFKVEYILSQLAFWRKISTGGVSSKYDLYVTQCGKYEGDVADMSVANYSNAGIFASQLAISENLSWVKFGKVIFAALPYITQLFWAKYPIRKTKLG